MTIKVNNLKEYCLVGDIYKDKISKHQDLYIYAMDKMRLITGYRDDCWIITGEGLNQRSWCSHYGDQIYKKI